MASLPLLFWLVTLALNLFLLFNGKIHGPWSVLLDGKAATGAFLLEALLFQAAVLHETWKHAFDIAEGRVRPHRKRILLFFLLSGAILTDPAAWTTVGIILLLGRFTVSRARNIETYERNDALRFQRIREKIAVDHSAAAKQEEYLRQVLQDYVEQLTLIQELLVIQDRDTLVDRLSSIGRRLQIEPRFLEKIRERILESRPAASDSPEEFQSFFGTDSLGSATFSLDGIEIPPEKKRSWKNFLAIVRLAQLILLRIHRLKKAQEIARKDYLTGLPNRRAFENMMKAESERTRRLELPCSFMMIDIDHFKSFNDTYGHLVGDIVLKAVANAIQNSSRLSDFVARYGGEEFAVLSPETPLEGAMIQAERIRRAVEHLEVLPAGHQRPLSVTVSIGVSDVDIDTADEALYAAKKKGRNRVETS
ncbi:MAG: GGDEF domain-containing protein [Candidatus Hydrogenedentota bacterium]|nr:MAG: GGDEF domain-containing protein [Candidatus Hydrogenedentota bacterium]